MQEIETYALLDDGSDVSLCNIDLVKQLGITGVPTRFSLTTVNDGTRLKTGEEVILIVSDLKGQEVDITCAWTVDKLPISRRSIPTASDVARWSHLDGIEFPELSNETVGIIIGSDVPEAHWVLDQCHGGRKEPYAIQTPLGWTLMGPIGSESSQEFQVNFVESQDNSLQRQFERVMQMDFSESNDYMAKEMSLEDQRALSIMKETVKNVGNHYEIALPWRNGKPALPNNRKMAERRLVSLQSRLKRDSGLREKYKNVMEDYIEKGYAARVPDKEGHCVKEDKESLGRIWYLPHHPVWHPQKPTKVCAVFDWQ